MLTALLHRPAGLPDAGLRRALGRSLALALALLGVTLLSTTRLGVDERLLQLCRWFLASLALLGPGRRLLRAAARSLRRRRVDRHVLVASTASVPWLYSTAWLLLTPAQAPLLFEGRPQLYFELTLSVVTLGLLGELLESSAWRRWGSAGLGLVTLRRRASPAPALPPAHDPGAPVQHFVDRLSRWVVVGALGFALLGAVTALWRGGGLASALVRAGAVLVIACPCAFGVMVAPVVAVAVERGLELAARGHGAVGGGQGGARDVVALAQVDVGLAQAARRAIQRHGVLVVLFNALGVPVAVGWVEPLAGLSSLPSQARLALGLALLGVALSTWSLRRYAPDVSASEARP